MRYLIGIFSFIGVIATIFSGLLALAFFSPQTFNRTIPKSYDYIFNWSGLNPDMEYEVIWDRSEAPNRDGPFSLVCFELTKETLSPRFPERWSQGKHDDWIKKASKDALISNADGCIPYEEPISDSTSFFLWRIVYKSQDRVDSATAIWFHQPTKRLLFVDWAV